MPRVVYQDYNHQARGRCDHKPDIAQVGMTTIKFKVKLNEATKHSARIKPRCINHIYGTVRSFEGWLHRGIYIIYIYI